MARPVRHSGPAPAHRLLLSSFRHLPLILGVSFGLCLSTAGLDLQQGMQPRRPRDARPAPTVRLVRCCQAGRRHRVVERGAESRTGTNRAAFHFLEMDRVQPPGPLSFSRRVPRCEASGDTMSPSSVSDRRHHSTVWITGDLSRFISSRPHGNAEVIAFCAFQVRWPGHRRVHVDRPPVAMSIFFLPVFFHLFLFALLLFCSFAPPLPPPAEKGSKFTTDPFNDAMVREGDSTSCGMVGEPILFSSSHSLVEVGSTQMSKTQRTTRNPRAEQPMSLDASGTLIPFSLSHLNTPSDFLPLVAFPTQQQQQQQTCCSVHRR